MSTESDESSGLFEFLTWVETHKQKLLVGGVGAMIIGGAVYVNQWQADQTEQAAGGALYEVQLKEAEEETSDQATAEDYLGVVSEFGGTSAAERALLLAAKSHFIEGEYDKARELFERFQTEFSSSDFLSTALYGVAASQDGAGNLVEAKSGFQAVLNRFPNSPIASQAKLAMASIHESSQEPVEALALYDELNRPGVPTSFSSRASTRRNKLLDAHPELKPEPVSMGDSAGTSTTIGPVGTVETETAVIEAAGSDSNGAEAGESEEASSSTEADAEESATDTGNAEQ